jgi:hypothetical protein
VEWHANRLLARQREKSDSPIPAKLKSTHPLNLIFIAYNVVYWLPIVLPFTPIMSYRAGFLGVFGMIIFRSLANLYRVNALTLEQAERFPLRIP